MCILHTIWAVFWSPPHPILILFFVLFLVGGFAVLFDLYSLFMHLFICVFLPTPTLSIITSLTCVHICFVELEDSSWTDHCGPFFSSYSPLYPPPLSGRLQRNWSLGGSGEEPGKGGTKGRPSAAITILYLLSSLPPVLPSLGPLASLPSTHWPAPQIKTSDKKMGSLKKGVRAKEREREGSP